MEYNPRYPQPFTLNQAIALDPEVAWDEIARLGNSLLHLRRSQNELREYLHELTEEVDVEVSQAVKENEITIASQDERIFMLKLALTHHGYTVASEQAPEPTTSSTSGTTPESRTGHPRNAVIHPNSNSQDHRASEVNTEPPRFEEHQNGVYL